MTKWGTQTCVESNYKYNIQELNVEVGKHTSYFRCKSLTTWYVLSGQGYVMVDGKRIWATPLSVFTFYPRQKYQVMSKDKMRIIQVVANNDV